MKDLTINEMRFVLSILKSPEMEYNANNMAVSLDISSMGALKIANRLVKEKILLVKMLGRAKYYRLNINEYVSQYLKFLLKREAEQSYPYIKRWIIEIRKIKNADTAILFGSVLSKNESAKDVDVLLITNSKKFTALQTEIEILNKLNDKKIHPIFQTMGDIIKNVHDKDKIVCDALKGIVVFGEDIMVNLYQK